MFIVFTELYIYGFLTNKHYFLGHVQIKFSSQNLKNRIALYCHGTSKRN